MASTAVTNEPVGEAQTALGYDMKLEVVTLPVSDVDRAKRFYQSLGWRLDADIVVGGNFRVVQLTPPHSACSVAFGKGVTTADPGSARRLILAVDDIDAAREDLVHRGADVSGVFHLDGGPVPGPDPEGRSYQTYASFSDPDGNGWLLQEIKTPAPGPRMGRLHRRCLSGRPASRDVRASRRVRGGSATAQLVGLVRRVRQRSPEWDHPGGSRRRGRTLHGRGQTHRRPARLTRPLAALEIPGPLLLGSPGRPIQTLRRS